MPTLTDKGLLDRIREAEAELKADGVPAVSDAETLRTVLGFKNVRSIHRAIERDELTAAKIGNRWRVRRREVARFLVTRES